MACFGFNSLAHMLNTIKLMLPKLKNKKDYQAALNRLEKIFDARPGTPQGDELEVPGILIDKYE